MANSPEAKPGDSRSTAAAPPAGRGVARADLEAVIRRAVELAHVQGDVEEQLSEAELVRIGTELGLPAAQVRQALYEQPQLRITPRWYDRWFEQPLVTASRVVPAKADRTLANLEEYISAREYMQLVRKRGGELSFIPAEDAISRMARSLSRSGRRYHIGNARRVIVSVDPLEAERSHVKIEADLEAQRKSIVSTGLIAGSVVGTLTGLIPSGLFLFGDAGHAITTAIAVATSMGVSVGAGVGISMKIAANTYHEKMRALRRDIDGLLDRAEHRERLEPPPAPWRRSLAARFFGEKKT
ncbi:MAG TPA: hypothetical protein VF035_00075 [Longimicrobiales bacterium]